jgi:hypothetical protein
MTRRLSIAFAGAAVTAAVAAAAAVGTLPSGAAHDMASQLAATAGGAQSPHQIRRSLPNGRTDVIKVMGNTRWSNIKLERHGQ